MPISCDTSRARGLKPPLTPPSSTSVLTQIPQIKHHIFKPKIQFTWFNSENQIPSLLTLSPSALKQILILNLLTRSLDYASLPNLTSFFPSSSLSLSLDLELILRGWGKFMNWTGEVGGGHRLEPSFWEKASIKVVVAVLKQASMLVSYSIDNDWYVMMSVMAMWRNWRSSTKFQIELGRTNTIVRVCI